MSRVSPNLRSLQKQAPKILLLLFLLLGLLVLTSWFINQWQNVQTLTAEHDRLQKMAVQNRKLEERLLQLNQDWELVRSKFPPRKDYAGLLHLLESQAQFYKVRLGPINLNINSGKGLFPYMGSSLELSGPFPQVVAFMDDIQKSRRSIILKDVSIALENGGVRAKMVFEAYYIGE